MRKLLRESDSGMSIRTHRHGLGIGLSRESRKIPISPVSNPMASIRAVELLIDVFNLVNTIVSRGDDFTYIA